MIKTKNNKVSGTINYPSDLYFSIKDIAKINPQFPVEITLRTKITRDIGNRIIAEIGSKTGGKGRPEKVFSAFPVKQTTLDIAESNGINLVPKEMQKIITFTGPTKTEVDVLNMLPSKCIASNRKTTLGPSYV